MEQVKGTREKLLEATLELISEKGYIGATTREIASRAGVSELTLFRKFGKKEHLFEEMLKNYTFLPRLRGLIEEISDLPVEEGLNTIGIRFLRTLHERRALVQILISEISHYPQKVRTIHQQVIDNLAKTLENYLEDRQARNEVRPIDMDYASFAFLRVLFTTFLNESILTGRKMDDNRIEFTVSMLVEIFLNGIAVKREV
jgi:AcrR family transcriptional regulator